MAGIVGRGSLLRSCSGKKVSLSPVAIFWDLNNKPPRQIKPRDAAVRLKLAAAKFGPVKFAAAYGDHLSLYRRNPDLNRDHEVHLCNVCSRRFFNRDKLSNHFKQVHEREQEKRIAKINSAAGSRRIRLVGELTPKMEKFRRAVKEMQAPEIRVGVGEEIRRAGIKIGGEIRADVAAVVEQRAVGCLMVVSGDGDLAGVLREARGRGLKVVVVGDDGGEGSLKRIADVGFSWREVASGKAEKEAPTVIERWKDRDLIRRLEWTYHPGEDDGDNAANDDDDDDDDPED